jgi:tRNA-Thr(GGU) m(6)t(6)A37 methyltransferase TsaA
MDKNLNVFENFHKLETAIKEYLNNTALEILSQNIEKLKEEKNNKYIDKEYEKKLIWVFNINTVHKYKGDFSSSSLQKFFHSIFKIEDDDENTSREEFTKFKNKFIEIFNTEFIHILSNFEDTNTALKEYINKFELKNGYLNVYFSEKGRELLIPVISSVKKEKIEDSEDNNTTFNFTSIGHVESCFPEKFSVPRQGNLLKLTKAKIILQNNIDISCLDGLDNFEYLWIVYVFHLNKNFTKTKISPPKYEGNKLGIFATRTPHRFNPIGLTLVKLEKIEKNEIIISSVDMITGTPILDIKPYHHLESLDLNQIKYPEWIKTQASEEKKAKVSFSEKALEELKEILNSKKLIFYEDYDEIIELIKCLLEIDPHSKYTRKKKETFIYAFYVDKLNIIYQYDADKQEVEIQSIEYSDEYKKLRDKAWLESYSQMKQEN